MKRLADFTEICGDDVDFCGLGSRVILPFEGEVHKAGVQSFIIWGSVQRQNLTVRHIQRATVLQREMNVL